MEFRTRISEQDFLDAYRLRCNSLVFLQKVLKILLYILTAICGLLLIIAFIKAGPRPEDRNAVQSLFIVLFNILPFGILTFCYVIFLKLYIPYPVRKLYRKDMSQKGEMAVQ